MDSSSAGSRITRFTRRACQPHQGSACPRPDSSLIPIEPGVPGHMGRLSVGDRSVWTLPRFRGSRRLGQCLHHDRGLGDGKSQRHSHQDTRAMGCWASRGGAKVYHPLDGRGGDHGVGQDALALAGRDRWGYCCRWSRLCPGFAPVPGWDRGLSSFHGHRGLP